MRRSKRIESLIVGVAGKLAFFALINIIKLLSKLVFVGLGGYLHALLLLYSCILKLSSLYLSLGSDHDMPL